MVFADAGAPETPRAPKLLRVQRGAQPPPACKDTCAQKPAPRYLRLDTCALIRPTAGACGAPAAHNCFAVLLPHHLCARCARPAA